MNINLLQGFFTKSAPGDDKGREIPVESHTEMQTALVMLARRDVESHENQVPFSWIDREGVDRSHFFDFRVSLRDGTRAALIVKNARKTAQAEFRADMRCPAKQVSPDFADKISLITEKHLVPVEVHNAELIYWVRRPDPASDAAVRRVVAGIIGPARISDIAAASGCGGSGFRPSSG